MNLKLLICLALFCVGWVLAGAFSTAENIRSANANIGRPNLQYANHIFNCSGTEYAVDVVLDVNVLKFGALFCENR